jgi:hypothetical protein
MSNQNNVYTSALLVDNNVQLEVPIYQRLFVWDEIQILTLLEDIYNAFKSQKLNYYIGIITVVERLETDAPVRWELVDGQQRLTFLTLLGTQVNWDRFIASKDSPTGLRIKYIGRPKDQNGVKALADGKPEECKNPNLLRFVKCYQEFLEKHRKDDLAGFPDYAYFHTAFLVSKLFSGYTPFELNAYFEKLNSTGRQLEPEDIVKGLYFSSKAADWNKLCEFSTRYSPPGPDGESTTLTDANTCIRDILSSDLSEKSSKLLQEPSADAEPRDSIRGILSLPVFLLHVLSLMRGDYVELNPRKLVRIFKDHAPTSEEEKNQFMEHMRLYREWLDKNIVHHTDEGLEFWQDMDEGTDDVMNHRKYLRQFQSMLTVSSGEQQRWALEAYRNRSMDSQLDACGFLSQLKQQDINRNKIEDVRQFKDSMRYPAINRYWFWRLDYILWELYQKSPASDLFSDLQNCEISAINSFRFKTNRSIEHVHPQTSMSPWDGEDLDSFGNLAMISTSFNSAQSNDDIGTKFGRVKDQIANRGALESIKMLLMFKVADRNETNWSQEEAQLHGEAMIKLLIKEFS